MKKLFCLSFAFAFVFLCFGSCGRNTNVSSPLRSAFVADVRIRFGEAYAHAKLSATEHQDGKGSRDLCVCFSYPEALSGVCLTLREKNAKASLNGISLDLTSDSVLLELEKILTLTSKIKKADTSVADGKKAKYLQSDGSSNVYFSESAIPIFASGGNVTVEFLTFEATR